MVEPDVSLADATMAGALDKARPNHSVEGVGEEAAHLPTSTEPPALTSNVKCYIKGKSTLVKPVFLTACT